MSAHIQLQLGAFGREEKGVAAIEFALLALIFMIGVLNAFELGRFAYQRMQVENAAYAGAQRAWTDCDPSKLPATTKCQNLNTAVLMAIQSTSLGSAVSLSPAGIVEGYYCVNASKILQSVGSVSSKPADCSAAGNGSASPGDYIQVQVTFSYRLLLPMTIMGARGPSTITKTSWMRLG